MKIVYVENIRLPTEKAHGIQIMKTCEALARQGLDIRLVIADRVNPLGKQDPFLMYGVDRLFTIERLPVIDVLVYVPKWLRKIAYIIERTSFVYNVKRSMQKWNDVEAMYTRDPVIADALIRSSKPVIVELHDDPRSDHRRWARIKGRVASWVVISHALESLLKEEGIPADRICYAPDGFDEKEFADMPSRQEARTKLGIPADVTLFVYTGQLFPWKGLDDLAPAFRNVPEGAMFTIIGGDEEDRSRLIEKAGKELERTIFIPRVRHAEVSLWLAAADAAILPTSAKFEIGRLYTSPLKLFEYLAAGLPIIASDVPSSREILDETVAIFFHPDDGISFIDALTRMKDLGAESFQRMSVAARERAQAYTWSHRGDKISAFIKSCIPRTL